MQELSVPTPSVVRASGNEKVRGNEPGYEAKRQSIQLPTVLLGHRYYRAVAITSQKHVTKHFRVAKKVLCSMATEGKSVSNSRSLCNICWIYPA